VLTLATWGEGGGWGGPHRQQKIAADSGFRPTSVVNSVHLGCSLRSGSRVGMQMGTHWIFVGQIPCLFALLPT
jgi:hypothetical protein